jgi:hypothetical protein
MRYRGRKNRTTDIRKVKYTDLNNSSMSDCGPVTRHCCSDGPITHCYYQSWPHSRYSSLTSKIWIWPTSCIQREAQCPDHVATDLSLSLKTGLLLSARISCLLQACQYRWIYTKFWRWKQSSSSAQNIKNRVGILCWDIQSDSQDIDIETFRV